MVERLANAAERAYWDVHRRTVRRSDQTYVKDPLEGLQARHLSELVDRGPVRLENKEWPWRLHIGTGERQRTTLAHLETRFDPHRGTIIFHHPSGMEDSYWPLIRLYFRGKLSGLNIISIQAKKHQEQDRIARNAFDTLAHQQEMVAGSVLMAEELVRWCRRQQVPAVFFGVSLGGVVGGWHLQLFNTADMYIPVVSYPNLSEICLSEGWEGLTADREERRQLPAYQQAYTSTPREAAKERLRVFPILGTEDRLVPFKEASEYWAGYDVLEVPFGHLGVATAGQATIRERVTEKIGDLIG